VNAYSGTSDRAVLSWFGGTYLDASGLDDIQGYSIYTSSAAGGPIDFTQLIDSVPSYPSGILTDGYGMGKFGLGGFGRAASFYQWSRCPLSSGAWEFAVVPHDREGNVQTSPGVVTVTIQTAPLPPGSDENGVRLAYSYSGALSRVATLTWLASPS